MDPDRINQAELREALDDWVQEYVWLLQANVPKTPLEPLEAIVNAARWFVSVYETCPTCHGSGIRGVYQHIDQGTGEHLGDQEIPCPDCVRGVRPTQQATERGSRAAFEQRHPNGRWNRMTRRARREWTETWAAGLLALLEEE